MHPEDCFPEIFFFTKSGFIFSILKDTGIELMVINSNFCVYIILNVSQLLKLNFDFEITVESQTAVRNDVERFVNPTPSVPSAVTSCKTAVKYQNQDIDVDTANINNISTTNRILHPFITTSITLSPLLSIALDDN